MSVAKGGRALRDAARRGDLARVKEAIETHHVKVDAFSKLTGFTPLQLAAFHGHFPVVEYLCANGAVINAPNHWNVTPLFWASMNGHTDIVRFLMAQDGIDVMRKTGSQRTALSRASIEGHLFTVMAIVEGDREVQQHPEKRQERIDAWNGLHQSPLYQAAWKGHFDIVQYLEENGADVNIVARDGRTAAAAATRRIKPFFALIKMSSPDEALAFVKKNDCRLFFAMYA